MGYDEIEECTQICALTLPWAITELPHYVMASEQVIPLGVGDTFSIYRKFLQLLAWQNPGRKHLFVYS